MFSAYWKIGPFPLYQRIDQKDWWESTVVFGPWFTCAIRYEYDTYSVWEEEPKPPLKDRFTKKSDCWPTLSKYF